MARLNTSLSPEAFAALRRFSEVSGQSMSSINAELLELCVPSFVAAANAMDRAKIAPNAVARGLYAALLDVQGAAASRGVPDADRLLEALVEAGGPAPELLAQAKAAAAAGRAGVGSAGVGSSDPRLVTRGSGAVDNSASAES